MLRGQFEKKALELLEMYPEGYDDLNWHIKYDLIDAEYIIRWTNGFMDRRRKEERCFYKNGEFIYY
jgi:hypothetical protein